MLDLGLLPPAGSPLVVAVSGGRDSVVMWDLVALAGSWPLIVWHLDHGLREDTLADADVLHALARRHRAEGRAPAALLVERTHLGDHGVEAAGRQHRYARLATIAQERRAPVVVTAHHQDDQAETVLFNLLRGADLTGRAGIAPQRILAPGVTLVRPLLNQPRARLADHATARGLTWHEDSTNQDVTLTRNYLRLRVLPTLEQGVPGTTAALVALAHQAQARLADLDQRLDLRWRPGPDHLPLASLQDEDPDLRHHAWRRLIRHLCLTADRRTLRALDDLAGGGVGRAWSGAGWRIERTRTGLSWRPDGRRQV